MRGGDMVGETDEKDKKESRTIAMVLLILVVALTLTTIVIVPMASGFVASHFAPGMGLKSAAIVSFFLTLLLMVVLAVAGGDGLLGEVQYMLGSFLLFFTVFWLMLAWIF